MANQKLNYSKEQKDTIRYWQQQMQEKEVGGIGYDNFIEKHGPLFAAQVERMGSRLNSSTEQQGRKLNAEDNLVTAAHSNAKDNFWKGGQSRAGESVVKGLSQGGVGALNFVIDAGREMTDLENYAKIADFVGNTVLPGKPLAMERWTEEMKAKALQRNGGFGFYGRAIATPGDAKKYFNDEEFYEARPWLKMVKPFEGEDLGALGTGASILVQEIAFMGPLAFLRLAKAAKHVTHFTNVADRNYGRILSGKSYLKPKTELDVGRQQAGITLPLSAGRERYVAESATRTHKQMANALSESLGRNVSVKETKALQKLNARYGSDNDFFSAIKGAGDRSDVSWKNSLQKLAATLNPKEARKIQSLVNTGTARGRFLFKGSAGGAYKETELIASTAAISGGAWMGEAINQDFVVLGEVGGGLMGPSLVRTAGGAVPDAWNTLRYHFGSGDITTKEDTLLAAAFGKTKKQIEELKRDKNKNQRVQLLNMAKTLPLPKIPILFDFATTERKKLKAYRGLASQIEDLPADIQAEIGARIERAEELLGDNPDIYASLSAITGITVLETIEQSARAKDTLGKGVSINLNPDQLRQTQRKIQTIEGLVSRLEDFKSMSLGAEGATNSEMWGVLNNRIVAEVQSHLDDLDIVNDRSIKQIATNLRERTDGLIEEVANPRKIADEDLEQIGTVTKDDYWKSKGADNLTDVTDDGQISGFSKTLQDDYNKFKTEQGAFIVNDSAGNQRIMFNHGVSNKTLEENMNIHNDMLVQAFKDDKKAYKEVYDKITGYSDYTLKTDGNSFLRTISESIVDNTDETAGGIRPIINYRMESESKLMPFIFTGRKNGLLKLGERSQEALDRYLFETSKLDGVYDEAETFEDVAEEIAENRETLINKVAKDIRGTDLYDVLDEAKIQTQIPVKGMIDARGNMFRQAHVHSTQNGGDGAIKGMYEYKIAKAIDNAVDKVGNSEVKNAQKVYKERYADKWLDGLTFTMFGRALRKGDYDKFAKFDKFFKGNPVDAKNQFSKVYRDESTGNIKPQAIELLKDSLARYNMQPDAKPLSNEWFNAFGEILDLKPLSKTTTGDDIPGAIQYGKGNFKFYGDAKQDFVNERNVIKKQAGTNIDTLMKMLKTSAVRKQVFGDNISLEAIERLSKETDPQRFQDLIMKPSADGGYDNMAEAVIDVINRAKDPKEKAEAMKSFKVILWQGAMDKVVTRSSELGFDSTQRAFKSGQDINASALDEFISTNKNVLKKIYSEKEYGDMEDLNELVQLVAGNVKSPTVSGMPKPMTIPAVMSRVYGIFRGVISPKYVITELLYQDARFRRGKLLEDIATDPDAARIMADVVIYNRIKNRKIRSEFTRYWTGAGQRFASDWYEDPAKAGAYSENVANDIWNEQHDDDYEFKDE